MPRGGKREGAGRKAREREAVKLNSEAAKRAAEKIAALPVKKQHYVAARAAGMTKLAAGLEAGFAETVARNAKASIETKDVQEAFAALIQAVIPPEKLAARLLEGLDATEKKVFSFQGQVFDEVEVTDWEQRRKYAELAAKFGRFHIPNAKIDHTHSGSVELKARSDEDLEHFVTHGCWPGEI